MPPMSVLPALPPSLLGAHGEARCVTASLGGRSSACFVVVVYVGGGAASPHHQEEEDTERPPLGKLVFGSLPLRLTTLTTFGQRTASVSRRNFRHTGANKNANTAHVM